MKVKVALVQTRADADATSNLERTLKLIDQAAKKGAEVVCLQELFLGPYFPQRDDQEEFDRAEAVPGPTTKVLEAKAKQHKMVILASLFEKRAKGLYHNTLAVIDADGTYLGKYRKMHIPEDPRFYEKFYFAPGDLGFKAWKTKKGHLGTLVCWDQWYPEAARLTALQGADVLLYPTAIGTWHGEMELKEEQLRAWHAVQRGHAVANGCYVVAVNRVGTEGELDFWGHSFVFGPGGETVYEAGEGEEVAVVELDLGRIETIRRGWPFLRDRRVDAYGDLAKRFVD
ncbi:MAG TPA: carbon-nitrogen hydrolase [Candidatus Thermoplasmatota archaeon]|nr:carbon-nitrogen hydrolase [Candidatus Thermoplasmatota archaeon]